MHRSLNVLYPFLLLAALQPPLTAQAPTPSTSAGTPRFSLALGYNNIRANAPPADCGCFNMNGGFASANLPIRSWFSAAVEVTGGHADNISPLGQNLTLTTFTAGPRVTLGQHRVSPFAQALFGAAHGSDSYFPQNGAFSTSSTAFAFSTGGGVDLNLNSHVAIRLAQAQYLHTGFPNGSSDAQHHLMLGAGLVFKFGGAKTLARPERPSPPPAPPAAQAAPAPVPEPPVAENTPPQPTPPTPPPTPVPSPAPEPARVSSQPAEALPDILFDYNSAELRPDAEPSLAQATALLSGHPESALLLYGYTDQRGSDQYNLALGKRRARTVEKALVRHGIRPDRLHVLSKGKHGAVCSTQDESCWQKNRRVALVPKP